jgi:hypothetical protein
MLYNSYAADFAAIAAPKGPTPIDLALLVALGEQADLAVDDTAERLRTDPAWKYVLQLPLDHSGCTGDLLWRFVKRMEQPHLAQRVPFGFIIEMVRMAFAPRRATSCQATYTMDSPPCQCGGV